MSFHQEPTTHTQTILSDLQSAWLCLRDAVVVTLPPSETQHRLLFHIDEAMRCAAIRDLERMDNALLFISNLAIQDCLNEEIQEWIETIREGLAEVIERIQSGERL